MNARLGKSQGHWPCHQSVAAERQVPPLLRTDAELPRHWCCVLGSWFWSWQSSPELSSPAWHHGCAHRAVSSCTQSIAGVRLSGRAWTLSGGISATRPSALPGDLGPASAVHSTTELPRAHYLRPPQNRTTTCSHWHINERPWMPVIHLELNA